MTVEDVISVEQQARVVDAIRLAELNTSGEVKVHLERFCKGDALDRAKEKFAKLDLHKTALRNAVIVYVAVEDRKAAIFGDEGIHTKVDADYWKTELDMMLAHFKKGEYAEGLIQVVTDIGEKLKAEFPYNAQTDSNEVSNDISR
jgi:uncharacterized membrane protein